MEQQVSIQTLIIAVSTSFVGSLFFFWFLRNRATQIRSRIRDLQLEEEFLDRIKKGNVELIRSGLRFISISLFLAFASGASLIACKVFPIPDYLVQIILSISFAALAAAAALCLSFLKSLLKLKDIRAAKENLYSQRRKLESKL